MCIDDCKYAVLRQSFCLRRRPLGAAPGGRVEPDRRRRRSSCRTYEARELLRSSLRRERSASVVPKKGPKCFGRPYEGGEVHSSSLRRGRSAFVVHLRSFVRSLNSERIWPSSPLLSPYYYRRRLLDEPPRVADRRLPVLLALSKGPLDETRWSLIDG